MKRHILIATFAALNIGAVAQDLHTEITVDRTVLPDVREASRPGGLTPSIIMPPVRNSVLTAAEFTDPGAVDPQVSPLSPARCNDTISPTPYRGYIAGGYFPLFHAMASAGYRIVDSSSAPLDIWAQYDGNSHNGDMPHYPEALFTNHIGHGGLKGAYRSADGNYALDYSIDGMAAIIRNPYFFLYSGYEHRRSYNQKAYRVNPRADWTGLFGEVRIDVALGWERFRMFNNTPLDLASPIIPHVRQNIISGAFGIGLCDGGRQTWTGLDIDVAHMHSNRLPEGDDVRTGNLSVAHFRPYVRFDGRNINGHAGLNVSLATGVYGTHVKVAPDVLVAWQPLPNLTLYGSARGGEELNRMSDIFALNPYVYPCGAYSATNNPVIAEGGIHFSPISGLRISAEGGYAVSRAYLSPFIAITRYGYMTSDFRSVDFNSWYAGASISYTYATYATFAASYRTGGADNDINSWQGWRDAADNVASASLKVTPVAALDLTAEFQLRGGRKALSMLFPYGQAGGAVTRVAKLSDVRNLNFMAAYRITPRLTAFINLDNILCHRYLLISGMPSQSIGGLVGAAYKF